MPPEARREMPSPASLRKARHAVTDWPTDDLAAARMSFTVFGWTLAAGRVIASSTVSGEQLKVWQAAMVNFIFEVISFFRFGFSRASLPSMDRPSHSC